MKEKDEISKVKKSTIEELFCRSKKYRQTTGFIRFFEFIARINNHSRFNSMLVYNQDETVTFFGSAKYWQDSYRRTVKEDARKYVILQPFAPIMWVYDIFMTEGRETPREILENGAGTEMFQIKGKIDNQILYDAISITQSWGIGVTFKPLSFFNTGYVKSKRTGSLEIALKEGMSYEQNLNSLIHELGHIFLGHTRQEVIRQKPKEGIVKEMALLNRNISTAYEELEAETVSFLICKKLGLTTASAEYLANFIPNDEVLEEFSYETVIKITDKIEEMFFKKWMKVKQIM